MYAILGDMGKPKRRNQYIREERKEVYLVIRATPEEWNSLWVFEQAKANRKFITAKRGK